MGGLVGSPAVAEGAVGGRLVAVGNEMRGRDHLEDLTDLTGVVSVR